MIDLNLCDPQHVRALLRIKEVGDTSLVDLLGELRDTAKGRLVSATDTVTIHRLQGRAEAFEDLLKAIEESPKVANRS
jgi:hypothetical protein|tara:strand:- start:5544 stop:5777 length:234 start_codon:yes stop_codon:yes gene_type:complete